MAARPSEDHTAPVASGAVNLLFIAPAMLLFGGFVLLPMLSAFYYAFTQWDGFTTPEFIGLANFQRARDAVPQAKIDDFNQQVGWITQVLA